MVVEFRFSTLKIRLLRLQNSRHGLFTYLLKDVSHCEPHRILAKLIEPLVWEEVLKIMDDLKLAEDLVTEAREIHSSKSFVPKLDELKRRIKTLENQQETLVGRVASLPVELQSYRDFMAVVRNWGSTIRIVHFSGHPRTVRRHCWIMTW